MPAARDPLPSPLNAALLLADGKVFWGKGLGAPGEAAGEICFNTAMTGYQEVLTDPSYQGQIVVFTFPHIGNVGVNAADMESGQRSGVRGQEKTSADHRSPTTTDHLFLGASGLVVREEITEPSNWRAAGHLNEWLLARGIRGVCGVDTRALTCHIRNVGAQNALIVYAHSAKEIDLNDSLARLRRMPNLEGMELAQGVSTKKQYGWSEGVWRMAPVGDRGKETGKHVVAVDYGEKLNILRSLAEHGYRVTVVPARTEAKAILALKPDGVFLSNGPGDPAATAGYAVPIIRDLIASGTPLFGICLGHQLLALALGAKTEKMHQGHRGANHPVQNLATGKVEITSQNHGFAVREDSLPEGVSVSHRSLFDGCVEGIRVGGKPVFGVQYHPESSPGPHDSFYLFGEFTALIESHAAAQ